MSKKNHFFSGVAIFSLILLFIAATKFQYRDFHIKFPSAVDSTGVLVTLKSFKASNPQNVVVGNKIQSDFVAVGQNNIFVREYTNATRHLHPWLATCIVIVVNSAIVGIIMYLTYNTTYLN